MCLTVALAGASQVSCQWVHKHVIDRCDKSIYTTEDISFISFYCQLLSNETQECQIYPRRPLDSNTRPEDRNISCAAGFIQTINPQQVRIGETKSG